MTGRVLQVEWDRGGCRVDGACSRLVTLQVLPWAQESSHTASIPPPLPQNHLMAAGTSYQEASACLLGSLFAFSLITLPPRDSTPSAHLQRGRHTRDCGREGAQRTGCLGSWEIPDLNSSGFSMTPGLKQQQQRNSTSPPPPSRHRSTAAPTAPPPGWVQDLAQERRGAGGEPGLPPSPVGKAAGLTASASEAQAPPRRLRPAEVTGVKVRRKTKQRKPGGAPEMVRFGGKCIRNQLCTSDPCDLTGALCSFWVGLTHFPSLHPAPAWASSPTRLPCPRHLRCLLGTCLEDWGWVPSLAQASRGTVLGPCSLWPRPAG